MDALDSSKAVVSGSVLADYRQRMRVGNALFELASDLDRLFLGYEELSSMMRSACFELIELAERVLPFEVDHSF